ncbi:MAG: MMPL family transporter [Candidatus Riflebacteria bacterium]|nr:MMPL family transporter [Candidatus Riflebacteria bacterium]
MIFVEFVARCLRFLSDRYYKIVFAFLAVLFLYYLPSLYPIKVNNTLATLLEQGTAQEEKDKIIKKTFGDIDEISILVYHAENLFTVENLNIIVEITDRILDVKGVKNCFSLSSTPFFKNVPENGELTLYTEPLLKKIPKSESELSRLKQDAVENRLFRNNIISRDGNTAAFNIIFQPDTDPFFKESIIREIRKIVNEYERKVKGRFYFTGMHVFMETTGKTMQIDVEVFSILSLFLLFFALMIIFRSYYIALVGIVSAVVSNGLLFISLYILNRQLSISTTPVPAITMGLSIAYTLHLLVAKHEGTIDDPDEIQEIFVGAFFSALTSIIGFLSLCLNPIPTLQDFGLYAAMGTFFAGWTSLFLSYPLLKLFKHTPNPNFARRFKFLLRFATAKYRKVILTISVLLMSSGLLITGMEVQTDYYQYYLKSSPMTKAVDFVNRTVGGQYPVVVEIDTGRVEGVYAQKVLEFLEKFKERFEKVSGVDKVITYLDMLNEGYKAYEDIPPENWYSDSQKVSQIAMIVRDANQDLNSYYVSESADKTLIFVRTSHINSKSFENIYKGIKKFLEEEFPEKKLTISQDKITKFNIGGTYLRCVNSADNMAVSQFEGTFWEIIVLFTVAFFIIHSFKLTAIAFLANLIPIFGVYGLLSLLGETLNMGTTMIAAISLGIGVDDTIHFVVRYITALHKTGDPLKSTRIVIYNAGMSMLLASLMIALSFFSLAFSNIKPIYQLGVFTIVTMGLCFASNLFFVPVMITMLEKRRKIRHCDNV